MKTIFDNLRNYLVCGGVVLAVGVLGPSTAAGASMLIAFSLVLIAVNTLQSWLIIQIWLGRIGRFQSEVRPRWGRFKRRTFRIVLFLVLLLPLAGMLQGYGLLIRWALAGGK